MSKPPGFRSMDMAYKDSEDWGLQKVTLILPVLMSSFRYSQVLSKLDKKPPVLRSMNKSYEVSGNWSWQKGTPLTT